MKTLKVKAYGKEHKLKLLVSGYTDNDNMAIIAYEESIYEPYMKITVNLDWKLPPGYAHINVNNDSNIEDALTESRLAFPTGARSQSGFVSYPLYKFDMAELKEYAAPDSDYKYL